MRKIALVGLALLLVACSGQARLDYYQAVNVAGVAHSETQIAKFAALSRIATAAGNADDASSRTAAVMAIALMKQTVVQPAYIEDETLSWAKALAGPLTGVAALLIQADLSNQTNKENNKTARAQINAQTEQQSTLVEALSIEDSGGATADLAIVGLVDIAGQAIDASTTTSGNAIDGMEVVSVTGMTETGDIATTAINGVVTVAEDGFDVLEVITIDNNLTTLGIVKELDYIVPTP